MPRTRAPIGLILLAAAIAMSPHFVVGEIEGGRLIEVRIEDALILVLGLAWIGGFLIQVLQGRRTVRQPPLLAPILVWLGVGLLSVLTNLIVGNVSPARGFFYFLKEVEVIFLYFYAFYHIRSQRSAQVLVQAWFLLAALNVLWILAQLFRGYAADAAYWGAYGPGAIGEGAPFPSGGFFLLVSVFLLSAFVYDVLPSQRSLSVKAVLLVTSLGPLLGVFASGSRASVAGLLVAIPLILLLYLLKTRRLARAILLSVLVAMISAGELAAVVRSVPDATRVLEPRAVLWELTSTGEGITRLGIWERQLGETNRSPISLILGYGKSAVLTTEESHSQYVRNFVETGVLGSVAFLVLTGAILVTTFRVFARRHDALTVGLAGGAFVSTLATLVISISAEAFTVVRISETYWFFLGLTIAMASVSSPAQPFNGTA